MDMYDVTTFEQARSCAASAHELIAWISRCTIEEDTKLGSPVGRLLATLPDTESMRAAARAILILGGVIVLSGTGGLRTPGMAQTSAFILSGGLITVAMGVLLQHHAARAMEREGSTSVGRASATIGREIRSEALRADPESFIELNLLLPIIRDRDRPPEETLRALEQCVRRPKFPLPTFRALVCAWREDAPTLPSRFAWRTHEA